MSCYLVNRKGNIQFMSCIFTWNNLFRFQHRDKVNYFGIFELKHILSSLEPYEDWNWLIYLQITVKSWSYKYGRQELYYFVACKYLVWIVFELKSFHIILKLRFTYRHISTLCSWLIATFWSEKRTKNKMISFWFAESGCLYEENNSCDINTKRIEPLLSVFIMRLSKVLQQLYRK